ncbi:SDR family oxidoreductase [Paraglaciecola sp.]|uniref:SDR family NAD(P)-dependent oxidoreductase n=1 Tax=Paraglaciecola sp. TaxID=1920173 RepID=UPI0030F484B5
MNQLNVVITGANSGIGLATAKRYLAEGHRVFAMSRNIDVLESLKLTFATQLQIVKCDVSKLKDLEEFYQSMLSQNQKIDILVASAGIANAESLNSVTEASFDKTFDINVKGLFFTVQKAIPVLKNTSAVVLVGSIQAFKGAGTWAVYGASKAAVRSLVRSFAAELGPVGIRVNCISPGVTKTPIFEKFGFEKHKLDSILAHVSATTPLGRLGSPEEIANAIHFLCSKEASFIHGADLQVDGGLAQI